jgi:quercetin dioxygenase-like cupin family protein
MKVVRLQDVEKTKVETEGAEKAWRQLVLGKADGTPTFSFRVFTVEPGGHTPFHEHVSEHLNYVISGEGALVATDGEEPIGKGDFALVLPNERHRYRNTSQDHDLVLLCAVPREYE